MAVAEPNGGSSQTPSPAARAGLARAFSIRMGIFFGGYLALNGIYLPFFPLWLAFRGLDAFQIGVCLALPQLARIVFQPAGSAFANRAPNRRFAIAVFSILAALVFTVAGVAEGFWPLLVVSSVALTLWNMALPATDALALTGVRQLGLDYGRMRLVGSIGFILANLAGGAIVQRFAEPSVFWMMLGILVLSAALSLALPVTPPALRRRDDAARPPTGPARDILRDPALMAIMAVNALVQASHAILYSFGSIFWQSLGFSSLGIGVLWAIGVIAEISLFAFSGRLGRRLGAYRLLVAGASLAILRWALFATEPGYIGFCFLQISHGISFGATFLGLQRAIVTRVSDEKTASAQGFSYMMVATLMAAATFLAGPLYRALGGKAFLVMTVPAAAALFILLLGRSRLAREPEG